ncbi:diacylglycerol/lipid kinase family protein [Pokkaliibacter sp. CJK22405]|uniref:diacylglycerol/lipid kinase family protein n=1 Tax=Pokkaliibacter sp. CJK22405 TaxID=3384615 RepID=UPI003984FEE2
MDVMTKNVDRSAPLPQQNAEATGSTQTANQQNKPNIDLTKAPLHLVANGSSGSGQRDQLVSIMKSRCEAANRALHLHLPEEPDELPIAAQEAVRAAEQDNGIVIAAGGDGTIRTVVDKVLGKNVPMAVIPIGTFNFFARNHAVPEDLEQAVDVVLNGRLKQVDIGDINGEVFVINASLGLYTRLIRAREQHTSRWGRNRLVATISTLLSLLKGAPSLSLDIDSNGHAHHVKSPMVFMGINALQLHSVSLDVAHCALNNQLGVVLMKPTSRWALIKLCFHGLTRRLNDDESLRGFCASNLTIHYKHKRMSVVMDGERLKLDTPLKFNVHRQAVSLVVPKDIAGAEEQVANDDVPVPPDADEVLRDMEE